MSIVASAASQSDHATGEGVLVLSIVLTVMMFVWLVKLNLKDEMPWSAVLAFIAFFAAASQIYSATLLF